MCLIWSFIYTAFMSQLRVWVDLLTYHLAADLHCTLHIPCATDFHPIYMGGCCSSQPQQGHTEHNNLDRNKSQRQSNWTATSTIALRDSNLKVESKPRREFAAWPSMLPGNLTPRMLDPLFPKSYSVVSCAGSAKCSTRCGSRS